MRPHVLLSGKNGKKVIVSTAWTYVDDIEAVDDITGAKTSCRRIFFQGSDRDSGSAVFVQESVEAIYDLAFPVIDA